MDSATPVLDREPDRLSLEELVGVEIDPRWLNDTDGAVPVAAFNSSI
jgi:hypothetical protein